jgi:uroporphyrinogen-III synthase
MYLGLDASQYPRAIHYPVIRTELIVGASLERARLLLPQFTHSLFTSKSSVFYAAEVGLLRKRYAIAIGSATAHALSKEGIEPLVALQETQEGVIALLETFSLEGAFIFYPHSQRARPVLRRYLTSRNIRFFSLDLYRTILQRPEPVPSLEKIDEIIFTSPSTVDGFLQIFSELPRDEKLTCIGPITERYKCDKMDRQ